MIPAGCSVEDVLIADRYAAYPGYEYLRTRCDLIHRWQADGGDVVEWLAEVAKLPSPAADCPVLVQFGLTPRSNWNRLVAWSGDIRKEQDVPETGPLPEAVFDFPCTAEVLDEVNVKIGRRVEQSVAGRDVSVIAVTTFQPNYQIVRLKPHRRQS